MQIEENQQVHSNLAIIRKNTLNSLKPNEQDRELIPGYGLSFPERVWENQPLRIYKHSSQEKKVKGQILMLGHGFSPGTPGSFLPDDTIEDAIEIITLMQNGRDNLKTFLLGQGLGANIAMHVAVEIPNLISGCILSQPWLQHLPFKDLDSCKFHLLSKCCMKNAKVFRQPYHDFPMSRNPAVQDMWREDESNYQGKISAEAYLTLGRYLRQSKIVCELLKSPFLLIQGGMDKYCDEQLSRQLIRNSQVQERLLLYQVGMWHLAFREPEAVQIIQNSIQWVNYINTKS